jgi:hypothetical protein
MYRPKSTALISMATLIAVSLIGCSSAPEENLITNYFRASRLRDNTTLANIAMVSFRPSERGIVQDFSLTSVSEEQRRPMRAREYSVAFGEASAAEREFRDRKQAYQDENLEAIERVLDAEREDSDVARRDSEVQEAWVTWREEMLQHAQTVSDARTLLAEERVVGEASTFSPSNPIDITQYEGEIVSKEAVIEASVQNPDDETEELTLTLTLERAELTTADGSPLNGRWIITRIDG